MPLPTGARAIGVIAADGLAAQVLTRDEYTALVFAALIGLDAADLTADFGIPAEAAAGLRTKLAHEFARETGRMAAATRHHPGGGAA
ncbi:MAG TPA: hypothetical protein PKA33_01545 [Amaricoccus sp.]|uniref:hypothetical protein n=1 Tax=Amaricoccus sp. TaxID=1872485 RepID=UPI002BB31253|nr:hypothetical protein [Amaricoccus sp.]HMT98030.1 hypothetical protein [Amaricoccus sp.]